MPLDRPIRIAFCITELEPGGAERCLVELATRLDRRRFEPLVYCLGPRPAGNPTSLVDALERAGVPVRCLGARHVVTFPWIARNLRRQFLADAPRIVQSLLFHANVLGTIAAHRACVPHIVTGIRVAERRAGWHLSAARYCDRWVGRHVCVSQAVREFSSREGRLPVDKLVVIPNGVDVGRFAAAQPCSLAALGVPAGRRVITHVGRLDEQKRPFWLLARMEEIFAQRSDCDLMFVGDGPLGAWLKDIARELRIEERVHFVGYRADVPEILAASAMLVLASQWEGMPNVVLEAMAAGKPIVATDVEGVAEALGPAASQQTAAADDPEAFVAKALAILDDVDLASRLGAENQRRAQADFTIEAMVAAYERLYESLASADK